MDLNYEIRYLNGDEIIKLEKYLHDITLIELKQFYYFKFDEDRENLRITDKRSNRTIDITLKTFIDQTWKKLNIYFKFKDSNLKNPIFKD